MPLAECGYKRRVRIGRASGKPLPVTGEHDSPTAHWHGSRHKQGMTETPPQRKLDAACGNTRNNERRPSLQPSAQPAHDPACNPCTTSKTSTESKGSKGGILAERLKGMHRGESADYRGLMPRCCVFGSHRPDASRQQIWVSSRRRKHPVSEKLHGNCPSVESTHGKIGTWNIAKVTTLYGSKSVCVSVRVCCFFHCMFGTHTHICSLSKRRQFQPRRVLMGHVQSH